MKKRISYNLYYILSIVSIYRGVIYRRNMLINLLSINYLNIVCLIRTVHKESYNDLTSMWVRKAESCQHIPKALHARKDGRGEVRRSDGLPRIWML